MNVAKALNLLGLFPKRPVEFYDRVSSYLELHADAGRPRGRKLPTVPFKLLAADLASLFSIDAESILAEPELVLLERQIEEKIRSGASPTPFFGYYNADSRLARTVYLVCRALRPAVALETGVANGLSSSFLLQAMVSNNKGVLHSIDMPPLSNTGSCEVGTLIPENLKKEWILHLGPSRRVIRPLLCSLKRIDFFLHDSLHTYKNMTREFRAVSPYLSDPSVVLADDIEANDAFLEFVSETCPIYWAACQEEEKSSSLFGIAVFGHTATAKSHFQRERV